MKPCLSYRRATPTPNDDYLMRSLFSGREKEYISIQRRHLVFQLLNSDRYRLEGGIESTTPNAKYVEQQSVYLSAGQLT